MVRFFKFILLKFKSWDAMTFLVKNQCQNWGKNLNWKRKVNNSEIIHNNFPLHLKLQ